MWNPCFAPNLRGKTFHFFKLSKILDMGLLYMDFMMLSYVPSKLSLLRFFFFLIRKGYFVEWFLCTYWDKNHVIFLALILLMLCITIIDLHILNHLCISRDDSHLILVYNSFNVFLNILLRIFAYIFIRNIDL